jgi:hypothetical protein
VLTLSINRSRPPNSRNSLFFPLSVRGNLGGEGIAQVCVHRHPDLLGFHCSVWSWSHEILQIAVKLAITRHFDNFMFLFLVKKSGTGFNTIRRWTSELLARRRFVLTAHWTVLRNPNLMPFLRDVHRGRGYNEKTTRGPLRNLEKISRL